MGRKRSTRILVPASAMKTVRCRLSSTWQIVQCLRLHQRTPSSGSSSFQILVTILVVPDLRHDLRRSRSSSQSSSFQILVTILVVPDPRHDLRRSRSSSQSSSFQIFVVPDLRHNLRHDPRRQRSRRGSRRRWERSTKIKTTIGTRMGASRLEAPPPAPSSLILPIRMSVPPSIWSRRMQTHIRLPPIEEASSTLFRKKFKLFSQQACPSSS